LLSLLVANTLAEGQTTAKIVICEKIESGGWSYLSPTWIRTCFMKSKTVINSEGFEIAPKDETMKGLWMQNNKKIEFLPENVSDTYPNLVGYNAPKNSITQITPKNFKGLVKLEILYLQYNQIETIPVETFKDLSSMKYLYLGEKFL
jgi:hypothetical protein